jgi:glycogen operon protein
MGVRLAGDLINDQDERGEPIVGDMLLLLLNAHHEPIAFTLPLTKVDQIWEHILDTAEDDGTPIVLKGQERMALT